ncbi:MAG TPA: glutaredoxin family protein [Candidatus Limnocylindrales bacterium]|nr:glutaredoxin family protein [Candidatus Limnocylindrales bacterium]
MTPLPELILYTRAGCGLCAEAREAIQLVSEDRAARNLAVPSVVEVDIETDPDLQRRLFDRIPVVELGDRRVELVITVGKLRRLLNEALGDAPAEPAVS